MPVMLERWNDDRMDALAAKVNGIEVQLREHRREIREDIGELRREMHQMQRAVTQGAIALSSTMIVGFATVLAAQL